MTTEETATYGRPPYVCLTCGAEYDHPIIRGPAAACTSRWKHKPCLDAGHPATMVPVRVLDATGWRSVRPGERTKREGWAVLESEGKS